MKISCTAVFHAIVLAVVASVARAGEAVRVENASHPTQCAEEDNVYVKLAGAGIRRFTIEAKHPAYAASIESDSTAPDFTHCDQSHDPSYSFAPKDLTLYEDADYALVGHSFAHFWRPESVDFRVGGTVTRGLHLVQLFHKAGGRRTEILVLYPADGYWRAKPLPPPGTADTAYGSSFLIGPIEEDGRPFVRLSQVTFDPKGVEFSLGLATGTATLRVMSASAAGTRLEVTLPAPSGHAAFAALRSMFVSPEIADTAEIVVDPGRRKTPILAPIAQEATEVTFARTLPSGHNMSAPDLSFGDFAR